MEDFGDGVAAATNATFAAADRVQTEMAAEVVALVDARRRATDEANALAAQQAALAAVAAAYEDELERLWSSYPQGRPAGQAREARLPADAVVRAPDGGWAVAQPTLDRLNSELRGAQHAAREASQRTFSGRHRRDVQSACESILSIVRGLRRRAEEVGAERDGVLRRRDADTGAARFGADLRLAEAVSDLSAATRGLPPAMAPWDSATWASWRPVFDHPLIRAGTFRLQSGQLPGQAADFGLGVSLPTFLPIREALRLSHRRDGREAAFAMARSLVLRALASTPPGKLRLSFFDPTGLGQSVGRLLELGEYDRSLIGGKVWSVTDDLQRVLSEQTAHIELVIQKYLRAEYASLEAFNAAAGEIAEPYRLLVAFDCPSGFDERTWAELRRVIENGPRCGVATLLVTDEDLAAPYGVALDALPSNLRTIHLQAPYGHDVGDATVLFDLVPDTDAEAPDEVVRAIIDGYGRAAQERTAAPVAFERCFELFADAATQGRQRGLPRLGHRPAGGDPETWWSETTVAGFSAPIGLRGARDLSVLSLDSSDHSGALLVGRQGSGKSTLLHTFIAGLTTVYGPEELELHLVDFKEGVEFKVYGAGALPHARTVAIESDRDFGLSVLQALQAELAWRGSLLRGSESHSSLETLRRATGERLPRILLIFDEFQVLFARNDKLGTQAAEALEALIRQGRGFGIHVLLGSQSLAGLDALGSHVPQLLPVRILLPATGNDAFKVLGENNTEGTALTVAGEGILNMSGGAVEANERFRGAVIEEATRRERVAAMREKADAAGFTRRPVVYEGNAPIPAEDTPPEQFLDEMRGADQRTLRLRFGAPMALTGSADINLRREGGANVLLVARDAPVDTGAAVASSLPRAVTANLIASAVAQEALVEVVDFLPVEEGLASLLEPLAEASAIALSRRRQVPTLLERIGAEVERRTRDEDGSGPATFLVLYALHRARDFDQDSVDYDTNADLPELLARILRDGPEVGVHTFMWFETLGGISRRLPSSAMREVSWRLAGRMSADDSAALIGAEGASSLRDSQLVAANEDRGVMQRCTAIAEPPRGWMQEMLARIQPRDPIR